MNLSLMAMFKIFLIQCLLTALFAIPFEMNNSDQSNSKDVQVQVADN